MNKVAVVIPARYASTRFPGKLLAKLNGRELLWWDINGALKLKFSGDVWITTEDEEIINFVKDFPGIKIARIPGNFGTERVYKFYIEGYNYDYYMSWPADEPFINPDEINRVWPEAKKLLDEDADVVTLWTKFYNEEDLRSNLSCKLAVGRKCRVLYFSRNIIPATKNGELLPLDKYRKHVGVFFFKRDTFRKYGPSFWWGWQSETQTIEGLEQNRFIDGGMNVCAVGIKHIGFGIDKPEQIKQLEERLKNDNIQRSG